VQFAHLLIFFVAIAFILQALVFTIYSKKVKRSAYKAQSYHNGIPAVSPSQNAFFKRVEQLCSIMSATGHNAKFRWSQTYDEVEFHIQRGRFIRNYSLPLDFDFGAYLCKSLDHCVVSLVNVQAMSWFVVILMVLGNAARVSFQVTGTDDAWTEALFCLGGWFLVGSVTVLLVKARAVCADLLQDPNCTDTSVLALGVALKGVASKTREIAEEQRVIQSAAQKRMTNAELDLLVKRIVSRRQSQSLQNKNVKIPRTVMRERWQRAHNKVRAARAIAKIGKSEADRTDFPPCVQEQGKERTTAVLGDALSLNSPHRRLAKRRNSEGSRNATSISKVGKRPSFLRRASLDFDVAHKPSTSKKVGSVNERLRAFSVASRQFSHQRAISDATPENYEQTEDAEIFNSDVTLGVQPHSGHAQPNTAVKGPQQTSRCVFPMLQDSQNQVNGGPSVGNTTKIASPQKLGFVTDSHPTNDTDPFTVLQTITPLFANLSAVEYELLTASFTARSFKDEDVIFKQGDQPDTTSTLFIIASGEVFIMKDHCLVARKQPGQYFGEHESATFSDRNITAVANGPVVCACLGQDACALVWKLQACRDVLVRGMMQDKRNSMTFDSHLSESSNEDGGAQSNQKSLVKLRGRIHLLWGLLEVVLLLNCVYFALYCMYHIPLMIHVRAASGWSWIVLIMYLIINLAAPVLVTLVIGPVCFKHLSVASAVAKIEPTVIGRVLQQTEETATLKREIAGLVRERLAEFRHGQDGIRRIFDEIDTNCNGCLDLLEFKEGLAKMMIFLPRAKLDSFFHAVDVDKSGGVDYAEFMALVYNTSPCAQPRLSKPRSALVEKSKSSKVSKGRYHVPLPTAMIPKWASLHLPRSIDTANSTGQSEHLSPKSVFTSVTKTQNSDNTKFCNKTSSNKTSSNKTSSSCSTSHDSSAAHSEAGRTSAVILSTMGSVKQRSSMRIYVTPDQKQAGLRVHERLSLDSRADAVTISRTVEEEFEGGYQESSPDNATKRACDSAVGGGRTNTAVGGVCESPSAERQRKDSAALKAALASARNAEFKAIRASQRPQSTHQQPQPQEYDQPPVLHSPPRQQQQQQLRHQEPLPRPQQPPHCTLPQPATGPPSNQPEHTGQPLQVT
jgi:hypothetical protein